jgi:hypothetical protein
MTRLTVVGTLALFMAFGSAGCDSVKCKVDRWKCDDACGDGLLGKVCQDVCTWEYNSCVNAAQKGR